MKPCARLLQLHGVIVDLIYNVEAVPPAGAEATVQQFSMHAGGGFNAMLAAKRSGMEVTYGGSLGTGPLSDFVANALADEAIASLQPRDPARDQGCCTVMIDRLGERTFVAAEGAEGHASKAAFDRILLSDFDWSIISGYTLYYKGSSDALTAWLQASERLPNLVFDPSPVIGGVRPETIQAVLEKAAWVSANASEAEVLTGVRDPVTAAARLAGDRAGGSVVRMGAQGCIVASQGHVHRVPGHTVAAVDTNGAGDTHIGSFIAALARGHEPGEAALYANTAAALSTMRHGPATAPDLATVEAQLRFEKAG
ncbi:MAG: PfkB family carbohydrate kinase [Pseudomonadota bacterium]